MSDQVANAALAVAGGLLLAAVFFIPFAVLSYRRRGGMSVGRTLTWVAALVYGLAIWTFTLVPFPDPATLKCVGRNTRLLQVLDDIRKYPHALADLLHNPAFLQFAYNIALFVPLGFVTRLLWRRGVVVTTVLGFALSLFIETTQLTGVWGLYSCAYRYFDVDDLLANTSGAFAGAVLSWPVARLVSFDARPDPDRVAPAVTRGRRLVGAVCDALAAAFLSGLVIVGLRLGAEALGYADRTNVAGLTQTLGGISAIVLTLAVTLATGRTPGDWAVDIRFARADGTSPLVARLLRYLGGIGGYLVLGYWPMLGTLFAAIVLVALLATAHGKGLAGLLSGQTPAVTRGGSSAARTLQAARSN
ncbi:MAG: VanZ family protein [Propionibacteriaceae bacterium]|jgi:glycopeptide antibiotics resistance protein|nr:VanZ family protein [Propionibacteriaceae bacterium]